MNLHHFPFFWPNQKIREKKNIIRFSSIPYSLRPFEKKYEHAHNAFFDLGFWALLKRRVDEIKNSKIKSFYNYLSLTHHLPAITEFSIFLGHLNVHDRVFVVQGDQLYMTMCFWYLVKSYLFNVSVYCSAHWTRHFSQVTRKIRPCLSGRVVPCRARSGCWSGGSWRSTWRAPCWPGRRQPPDIAAATASQPAASMVLTRGFLKFNFADF